MIGSIPMPPTARKASAQGAQISVPLVAPPPCSPGHPLTEMTTMKTNAKTKTPGPKTHEGAPAVRITPTQSLRRLVLSCLLFEDQFYIDGQSSADMIHAAAEQVPVAELAALAIEARSRFHLRHVPLWLLVKLIERGRGSAIVAPTIAATIQRADEMGELLALYWKAGKRPLAKQLQKGLAQAFGKFGRYALAKYDRDASVKLRDVLFLSHAKPRDEAQAALWKSLVDKTLEAPDTWEVALSAGADKAATFTRLLEAGDLGYLALLRNLRNMAQAGVDPGLVKSAIIARKGAERVLPFRYTAAARAAPQFEPAIDEALCGAIQAMPVLPGKTIVLVDVSGSMDAKLSAKSDLTRMDAAATLASIIPGDLRVFSFSNGTVEVPPRRGMAGVDAILRSQAHEGTALAQAVEAMNRLPHDRLIVITDEQAGVFGMRPGYGAGVPEPKATHAYMINVAAYQHGVGYGRWVHIDGFSEAVLTFIGEHEAG
jgi:60 kDa SS-A/Ro ribonucleoprotein